MPGNAYHFVSRWHVDGTLTEVSDILDDAQSLSIWWGSVYSDVELTETGQAAGLGKSFRLLGHGWLPYTLHLTFRKTEDRYPNGFSVAVSGDLNGAGVWSFVPDGSGVAVTFDWTVSADKPLLRWFSPIFKPLFASNHRWTMRRGEESLRLELLRRRAKTDGERAQIPPPPRRFRADPRWLTLTAAAAIAGITCAVSLVRGRRRV